MAKVVMSVACSRLRRRWYIFPKNIESEGSCSLFLCKSFRGRNVLLVVHYFESWL